jgi:hypothetical protein
MYTEVKKRLVSSEKNRNGLGGTHFLLCPFAFTIKAELQHLMSFSLITTIKALCYLFKLKWYIADLIKSSI